jgi:hypothetical protein
MTKILTIIALTFTLSFAKSETSFPKNWNQFVPLKTVLTTIGALPGCNQDVSTLPSIYQETVATYCGVKKMDLEKLLS